MSGIRITIDNGESIQVSVRAQFVTFDLPALAQSCNITQFNGYDTCPDCMTHGIPIERQIFYPYSPTPFSPKTVDNYTILPARNFVGVLTKGERSHSIEQNIIVTFTNRERLHASRMQRTYEDLLSYWKNILLPGVFDQGPAYVPSIALPHCFGYQFTPISQCSQWKTKIFRESEHSVLSAFLVFVLLFFMFQRFSPVRIASNRILIFTRCVGIAFSPLLCVCPGFAFLSIHR